MEKNKKWLLIILLIIIIIPLAYFGISFLQEQIFYNGIKEISDIENKSDVDGDVIRNETTPSNKDYKHFNLESINATSTDILRLQN